jgi:PAS domain S-box-containing protein
VREPTAERLLIVDDEIESLEPLLDLVSEWGYAAKGFTSAREALEVLKEQDFDLLLTDFSMPDMDGIELFKAAVQLRPHLVCIIITGRGTVQTAVAAMKMGVFDYVLKPLDFKMLHLTLSRGGDLSRLRQSEEKYRSIVEDQTEFICRWQPDGTITFVNEVCCRYFGKTCQELIGQTFHPFMLNEDRKKLQQEVASLNPENPVFTIENRTVALNSEIRWQKWTNRALFNKQGSIAEFQSVGHDINNRKLAEEALIKSTERLRAMSIRLAEIEEAERKKLARELHDMVGQNLTALGINLNIVRTQIPVEAADLIVPRLQDSLLLLEQTALCIRDVMADLRPDVLDDYGLLATFRWYGEKFSHRTGLTVAVQGDVLKSRLPLTSEVALFRIVQEALTNIAKHAQASKVTVELEELENIVHLTIADDGRGFDLLSLRRAGDHTGWGLITMEERAAGAGGCLSIESALGKGTRIKIEVKR